MRTRVNNTRGGAKTKFARLYALSTERLEALDAMLMKGMTGVAAADIVVNEWKVYPKKDKSAVAKQITRYRNEVIEPNIVARVKSSDGTPQGRALVEAKMGDIDVLMGMSELIELQKKRINRLSPREEKMPMLMASLRDEIRLLFDMYKGCGQLQLDIGVLRRAPKQITGHFHLDDDRDMVNFEANIAHQTGLRKVMKDVMGILEAPGTVEKITFEPKDHEEPDAI